MKDIIDGRYAAAVGLHASRREFTSHGPARGVHTADQFFERQRVGGISGGNGLARLNLFAPFVLFVQLLPVEDKSTDAVVDQRDSNVGRMEIIGLVQVLSQTSGSPGSKTTRVPGVGPRSSSMTSLTLLL